MEGYIVAPILILVAIGFILTYEHYNAKKILEQIYIGRMVGFFEDQYTINGAVVSYNEKEVIISSMDGLHKTTINNIYFVD